MNYIENDAKIGRIAQNGIDISAQKGIIADEIGMAGFFPAILYENEKEKEKKIMNKKRFLALALAGVMAVSTAVTNLSVSWADDEVVSISTAEELAAAIRDQKPGQTWNFAEGVTITLDQDDLNKYASWTNPGTSSQGNWYFPIYANGIKINGNGATVTSDYESANGNWATQDFISVWGDNVEIHDLTIISKPEVNKAIEVMGQNFTIEGCDIKSREGEAFSGSLYFNPQNDDKTVGNVTIDDVDIEAWINAGSYVEAGTVSISDTTLDFSGNTYAGKEGYNLGISGTDSVVEIGSGVTYLVDGTADLNDQIFGTSLQPGVTVKLTGDVEIDKMLNITTKDVTLDLGGNTLTASDPFTSSYNPSDAKPYENDSHLVNVNADGVTITNGTLKTTEDNKNVLNIFESSNVTIGDLTLDHTNAYKGAPLVVNSSSVTVDDKLDLILGSASWYGINADVGSQGTEEPVLTFKPGAVVSSNAKELEKVVMAANPDYIQNPENAGLVTSGNGIYESDPSVIPSYEEDEMESSHEYGDYFGNEKWDELKDEIAQLIEDGKEGETIEFNAVGLPYFPASVAHALKGNDITLEVRKNGVTYTINGLEIGTVHKIWYAFEDIESELLTGESAEAETSSPAGDKENPSTGR